MANKYCNLDGSKKIKDEYQKINIGFDKVEEDVNKINDDINALDERVDEIITTPVEDVSAEEIIDARGGNPTLGKRFENIETAIEELDGEDIKYDNTKSGLSAENVQTAINEVKDELDEHKADMATKLGRTTFHCTALTGYKIVQSNCFVINNIAYINLEVQKNDETAFDTITHNVAQIPYSIVGQYAHLLANGLDATGNNKNILAPARIAIWTRNISVRPIDTDATRIFISGSFPIVI